jgi:hypothetical protein
MIAAAREFVVQCVCILRRVILLPDQKIARIIIERRLTMNRFHFLRRVPQLSAVTFLQIVNNYQ